MYAHRSGIRLTAEEQIEIFGTTAFSEEYAADAEKRWGGTDPEMHIGLAEMYLADERFTRYYENAEPGLARYLRDVIVASYAT